MIIIPILNTLENVKDKEVQIFLKSRDQHLEGMLIDFDEEIITLKDPYKIDYLMTSEISFIRVRTS